MFKPAWFCVKCDVELSKHEIMYSDGRCPYCGFKGESACTIVDVVEKPYKEVKIPSGRWWWPDSVGRKFITNPVANPMIEEALKQKKDTTGLCTLRELSSYLINNRDMTDPESFRNKMWTELYFEHEGRKINVEVKVTRVEETS